MEYLDDVSISVEVENKIAESRSVYLVGIKFDSDFLEIFGAKKRVFDFFLHLLDELEILDLF